MISGAHVILYTSDAEADRAFFRDVLGLQNIDAGGGWLIFALPPAELAMHPSESGGTHELYLVCDDVAQTVEELRAKGVPCGEISDEGWGLLTRVTLPGGTSIGIYEARHALAHGR